MNIKGTIKQLQKQVGAYDDGYWGGDSQTALIKSGKRIYIDFNKMRRKFGRLNQRQVDGVNAILKACNEFGKDAINPTYVAYMLATTWHETAHTMQPITEYGKGSRRRYGRWYRNSKGQVYGYRNGFGETYLRSEYPHLYYGRGDVQLTWLDNYLVMGDMLGIDLANNPDLANEQKYASQIMIKGMLGGMFTGLSLSDCIKYGLYFEFKKARKIINGTDKDSMIADYAIDFLECLIFI